MSMYEHYSAVPVYGISSLLRSGVIKNTNNFKTAPAVDAGIACVLYRFFFIFFTYAAFIFYLYKVNILSSLDYHPGSVPR